MNEEVELILIFKRIIHKYIFFYKLFKFHLILKEKLIFIK
jgi:hypothetical protein